MVIISNSMNIDLYIYISLFCIGRTFSNLPSLLIELGFDAAPSGFKGYRDFYWSEKKQPALQRQIGHSSFSMSHLLQHSWSIKKLISLHKNDFFRFRCQNIIVLYEVLKRKWTWVSTWCTLPKKGDGANVIYQHINQHSNLFKVQLFSIWMNLLGGEESTGCQIMESLRYAWQAKCPQRADTSGLTWKMQDVTGYVNGRRKTKGLNWESTNSHRVWTQMSK